MAGQPAPYPGDPVRLPLGTSLLERRFVDPAGTGLSGTLSVVPSLRHEVDDTVVVAIPFKVKVADGLLSVQLPPGVYDFTGTLSSPSGGTAREAFTVVVE